jgi:hypothetical protein
MRLSILLLGCAALLGCEWARYYTPPPAIAQRNVDLATLRKGRILFAHRCIECHTLPPIWHYREQDWPEIVNSMSHRAALTPTEREAIITYLLAVRAR